jgi:hypothetical protein
MFALKQKGSLCYRAPYEADSQQAALDRLNIVQYVLSDDLDTVCLGIRRTIRNLDMKNNSAHVILWENLVNEDIKGLKAQKQAASKDKASQKLVQTRYHSDLLALLCKWKSPAILQLRAGMHVRSRESEKERARERVRGCVREIEKRETLTCTCTCV